jgi:hypothetical protein
MSTYRPTPTKFSTVVAVAEMVPFAEVVLDRNADLDGKLKNQPVGRVFMELWM